MKFSLTLLSIIFCFNLYSQEITPPKWNIPEKSTQENFKTIILKPKINRLNNAKGIASSKGRMIYAENIGLFILTLPNNSNSSAEKEDLKNSGFFDFVEDDQVVYRFATPNDPQFSDLWGIKKINAENAWNISRGDPSLVVAIVDSGIDSDHPDLLKNLWRGGNNEVGYGFSNGNAISPEDDNGHGTHVAGTIGAVGNNSLGVVGVNWDIKLAAFKFLNSNGSGLISDAILCYNKMIDLKKTGVNIRVVNNSWGGGLFSAGFSNAVVSASNIGIISVFAAGNNDGNNDGIDIYPPNLDIDSLVVVLASDSSDVKASFSNYGYKNVDIAAPGVSIFSTGRNSVYEYKSGTSMASPHVAGAIALLLSQNPDLTPTEIKRILLNPGSYDLMSSSATQTSSGGRVNLYKLLTNQYINNPILNGTPTIIIPSHAFVKNANESLNISFSASDPDGDPLRFGGLRIGANTLYGRMLKFPTEFGNSFSAIMPSFSNPVLASYSVFVNDYHGNTSSENILIQINKDNKTNLKPNVTLSAIKKTTDPNDSVYTLSWNIVDPDSSSVISATRISQTTYCCYANFNRTFDVNLVNFKDGVVYFDLLTYDDNLNFVETSLPIEVGKNYNQTPPTIVYTVNKTVGTAPDVYVVDYTIYDPDSSNVNITYFLDEIVISDGYQKPSITRNGNRYTITSQYPSVFEFTMFAYDESNNIGQETVLFTTLSNGSEQPPQPIAPNAPSSFNVSTIDYNLVGLTWQDNSNNEDGFIIEKSIDSLTFVKIADLVANTKNFIDKNVEPDRIYYYRICAYNEAGRSIFVSLSTRTLKTPSPVELIAPFQLRENPDYKDRQSIQLVWLDLSTNEENYIIERGKISKRGNISFQTIAILPSNTESYIDFIRKGSFVYRVKACAGNFCSEYSNEVTVSR